jgi:hypothetical protein
MTLLAVLRYVVGLGVIAWIWNVARSCETPRENPEKKDQPVPTEPLPSERRPRLVRDVPLHPISRN